MRRRPRKPIGMSYAAWSRLRQSRLRWWWFTLWHRSI